MAGSEHGGHRQRLKERFLLEGMDNFEPHVVLELLLFYVIPQKDTNVLAHKLIEHFGSLSAVFEAPFEELKNVKGISDSSALLLKMVPELSRRYLDDKYSDQYIIDSTKAAGELFVNRFIGINTETTMLMLVDAKGRMLFCGIVAEGSIHSVDVSVKKIIRVSSRYHATGAIIAHNHPSGIALPSSEDLDTTETIRAALEFLNIELLDHIIIADRDYVSMADSGLLPMEED